MSSPLTFNDGADARLDFTSTLRTDRAKEIERRVLMTALADASSWRNTDDRGMRDGALAHMAVLAQMRPGRQKRHLGRLISTVTRDERAFEQAAVLLNDMRARLRILCVTAQGASSAMWKKYADCGRGVAIAIRSAELENACRLPFLKVSYSEHFPDVLHLERFFESTAYGRDLVGLNVFNKGAADRLVTTKHPRWRGEDEWRMYFIAGRNEHEQCHDQPFPAEAIDHIVLGPRCSGSDANRWTEMAQQIRSSIEARQAADR